MIAQYVDEEGNPIHESDTKEGSVGDNYVTQAITKDGYTLTKMPEKARGKFVDGTIYVKYVYKKIGKDTPKTPKTPETPGNNIPGETSKAVTQYVDAEGNAIVEQVNEKQEKEEIKKSKAEAEQTKG